MLCGIISIGEYLVFWLRLGLNSPPNIYSGLVDGNIDFLEFHYDGHAAYIRFGVWRNDYGMIGLMHCSDGLFMKKLPTSSNQCGAVFLGRNA